MPEKPVFSVITVCLEALPDLQKTAQSLHEQLCRDFEWLVIDGGSQDGTRDWLAQRAPPCHWVSKPDRGLYDAMNKGLQMARGTYVLFLNAGDMLAGPGTLTEVADTIAMQRATPDFIYGDSFETAADGTQAYKPARPHTKIARGMFTHHQAMIYRREILDGLRFDTDFEIAADYDLTCRFLQRARHVLYCPFALCNFSSGGLSQQNADQGRREQFAIRKNLDMTGSAYNTAIRAAQFMAWQFRRFLPRGYWRWRSRATLAMRTSVQTLRGL
jgi:putative colanic acid biosynthesis glycosyltransferase